MKKGEATRLHIINNAKKLFFEYGYCKTSLQMIADRSGISKSLVKYYFSQKSQVSNIIVSQYLRQIYDYVLSVVKNDPLLAYMLSMKLYYTNIRKEPEAYRFNVETMTLFDINANGTIDEMYRAIIEQFNITMNEKIYKVRKAQIIGAHSYIVSMLDGEILELNPREHFDSALFAACALLGVSSFSYTIYLERMYTMYQTLPQKEFHMLN